MSDSRETDLSNRSKIMHNDLDVHIEKFAEERRILFYSPHFIYSTLAYQVSFNLLVPIFLLTSIVTAFIYRNGVLINHLSFRSTLYLNVLISKGMKERDDSH